MNKIPNEEKILEINDDYQRALELVKILFAHHKDKEGEPYINHLIRVSNRLTNKDTRIAGLLHDTIEDITDFTEDDLRKYLFSEKIIELVKLVTKNYQKDLNYHDRISYIINSNNIEAIKLKYADILDNIDINRLNKLDNVTKNRLYNKYKDELKRLENILTERGEKL